MGCGSSVNKDEANDGVGVSGGGSAVLPRKGSGAVLRRKYGSPLDAHGRLHVDMESLRLRSAFDRHARPVRSSLRPPAADAAGASGSPTGSGGGGSGKLRAAREAREASNQRGRRSSSSGIVALGIMRPPAASGPAQRREAPLRGVHFPDERSDGDEIHVPDLVGSSAATGAPPPRRPHSPPPDPKCVAQPGDDELDFDSDGPDGLDGPAAAPIGGREGGRSHTYEAAKARFVRLAPADDDPDGNENGSGGAELESQGDELQDGEQEGGVRRQLPGAPIEFGSGPISPMNGTQPPSPSV